MITHFFSLIYSAWLYKRLTGTWRLKRIYFSRNIFRIKIIKRRNSKVIINGCINFRSHLGSEEPVRIILEEESQLLIDGDLEIGAGSVLLVCKKASLKIGGRRHNKTAGTASNCKILVKENVTIGNDVIMGWDVLITDSDWHIIEGSEISKPVYIGDKVWLSHHVSVHKGVSLDDGCLVSAHSLVLYDIPSRMLAGGVPAKDIRKNIQWSS